MPGRSDSAGRGISASTYLELLLSLFNTTVSTTIGGGIFIVAAWLCTSSVGDRRLAALALVGSVVAILRVAVLVRLRRRLGGQAACLKSGRAAERAYGSIYLLFAAILGLFAAMCLQLCPIEYHMVIAALIVGYGAGVAACMPLLPRIAIPAMVLAVVPSILSSLVLGDTVHLVLALVVTVLLMGGIRSILVRYGAAVEMIEMRQLFGSLARQDPLTGLANRFALDEALARVVANSAGDGIVLHCLDLDRFKPVNDIHGHVVGDLVLKSVAGRLQRLLRSGDMAVRLGGDEFAVLQTNVQHAGEGELLARRIAQAIEEPYAIDGKQIRIGVSMGSASGRDHGADLTTLLKIADVALYKIKHAIGASRALAS